MIELRAVQDGEPAGASPMINSAPRICRKCGAEIFTDAPEGLCTACLFETGLSLLTDESVAGGVDPGHHEADRAPDKKKTLRSAKTFTHFGDYELLDVIGRGGQGVVYRARQKSLNRMVALKVIGLGHWATEAHLKRFRREAEAAAQLEHPCIVPIYEVGEQEGSCYFSMKFVEGGQLDEVVKSATADSSCGEREPLSMRRAVELIAKVARTVHYAHEHGILHRDIKPGNILLDGKGEPHLTDFGLARLLETESTVTRTLEVLGTPSYMAPEQALGNNEAISNVTDVYGVGAVLYQLLTGHPPFAGGTTYETIKLLLDTEVRQPRLWNPKIDRDLSTICLKCLDKDPSRRYSSALALAEDLERWLKHEPIIARRTGIVARGRKWVRRNPSITAMAAMLVALAVPLGVIVWKNFVVGSPPTTGIAVLPFENLSDDKEHAFFADGVQDDILTKLSKIANLKVISRTSMMQYRGKQNAREIGNALRVSHVLEGTVRRSGGKVHINAQLVDTRTDAGIWAEEYDRNLNDVFAIETDMAQSVANRLKAKVSAREKAAMEEWPTKDLVAYDHYVQAASLIDKAAYAPPEEQERDYLQAVELLNQATARDHDFLLAYCRLAEAHDTLYFQRFNYRPIDDTPSHLRLAKSAIDSAFRLRPDSGEAHLALATHLYLGYFDFDRARHELALAVRSLPNNARIFEWNGYIDRRQSRWHDAAKDFERAMELDPRNLKILTSAARTYELMRDYSRVRQIIDQKIAFEPNQLDPLEFRASLDVSERADTRALVTVLEQALEQQPASADFLQSCLHLAWLERDSTGVDDALARFGEHGFAAEGINGSVHFSRAALQGLVAQMKGDAAAAHAAFTVARTQQEEAVRQIPSASPNYGPTVCTLGLIDAALGRKEEALQEGRRALQLTPIAKNSLDGADVLYFYAVISAWTGESDLAIQQLRTLAKIPSAVTYGDLRLNPYWDSLRGNPRFEEIVNSLAPR